MGILFDFRLQALLRSLLFLKKKGETNIRHLLAIILSLIAEIFGLPLLNIYAYFYACDLNPRRLHFPRPFCQSCAADALWVLLLVPKTTVASQTSTE